MATLLRAAWCGLAGISDSSRVAVIGGSHGGFLTGHLLGQHPDRFCCGVLRNPVCNLSFMAGSTDIPDWTFVEAFGSLVRARHTSGSAQGAPHLLRTHYAPLHLCSSCLTRPRAA